MFESGWKADFKKMQQRLFDEFDRNGRYHTIESPRTPKITEFEKKIRITNLRRKIGYMLFGPCNEVSCTFFYFSMAAILKSTSCRLIKKFIVWQSFIHFSLGYANSRNFVFEKTRIRNVFF